MWGAGRTLIRAIGIMLRFSPHSRIRTANEQVGIMQLAVSTDRMSVKPSGGAIGKPSEHSHVLQLLLHPQENPAGPVAPMQPILSDSGKVAVL
jgi:hypothetical protein